MSARLPPGQHAVSGFPRFGTHFVAAAPLIPADPVLEIAGDAIEPLSFALAGLADLPRTEVVADFHCVAGWSATDLRWEGVTFERFYSMLLVPSLRQGADVSHVVFKGLDGYRSTVRLEDAMGPDVLLAERLDGELLDSDHGAPLRLVSPSQYGFMSTKHLCRIELHTGQPHGSVHPAFTVRAGFRLVTPHERARVWHQERHRHLPAWCVGPVYRLHVPLFAYLAGRGSRGPGDRSTEPPQ